MRILGLLLAALAIAMCPYNTRGQSWNPTPMPAKVRPQMAPGNFQVPTYCPPATMCPVPVRSPWPGCNDPSTFFEGGIRAFVSNNYLALEGAGAPRLDFIKDMGFPRTTLLGEAYVSLRIPPVLQIEYQYTIPREDNGHGTLTAGLTVGDTDFAAGDRVDCQSTTNSHRLLGEFFVYAGPTFRCGPLLFGEVSYGTLDMDNGAVQDSERLVEGIVGGGVTGEIATWEGFRFKARGAASVVARATRGRNSDARVGAYFECEARYFPATLSGPYSLFSWGGRPYAGIGYRYANAPRKTDAGRDVENVIHGPWAGIGLVF